MLLVQRLLPRLLQQGGLLLRLQLALPLRLRRLRGLLLLLPVCARRGSFSLFFLPSACAAQFDGMIDGRGCRRGRAA